jgi:hypothetical protein
VLAGVSATQYDSQSPNAPTLVLSPVNQRRMLMPLPCAPLRGSAMRAIDSGSFDYCLHQRGSLVIDLSSADSKMRNPLDEVFRLSCEL